MFHPHHPRADPICWNHLLPSIFLKEKHTNTEYKNYAQRFNGNRNRARLTITDDKDSRQRLISFDFLDESISSLWSGSLRTFPPFGLNRMIFRLIESPSFIRRNFNPSNSNVKAISTGLPPRPNVKVLGFKMTQYLIGLPEWIIKEFWACCM